MEILVYFNYQKVFSKNLQKNNLTIIIARGRQKEYKGLKSWCIWIRTLQERNQGLSHPIRINNKCNRSIARVRISNMILDIEINCGSSN
jgi:hypothetical protein